MKLTPEQQDMVKVITAAADRHRIPRRVALAFAWVESRLNPRAAGDLRWSEFEGGKRYERLVKNADHLRTNPARSDPKCWHSYGLFQLLACYHVRPAEHPEALYDAITNADRGCAFIARLLRQTAGDVGAARIRYVGLPLEGASTALKRRDVLAKLEVALKLFENTPEKGKEPVS